MSDVTWEFLRPSPLAPLPKGEGNKNFLGFAPPLLSGRGGWGVRAIFIPRNISYKSDLGAGISKISFLKASLRLAFKKLIFITRTNVFNFKKWV